MTAELTPSAGLYSGFADKENGWGDRVNANWLTLELLSVPFVNSAIVSMPPDAPADGDRYIIPAAATGLWSGRDGQIVLWMKNQWNFFAPKKGWTFRSIAEAKTYQFNGTTWAVFVESISPEVMAKINQAIAAGDSAAANAQATATDRAIVVLAKSETLNARDIAATSAINALASKNAAQAARDQAVAAKTDAQTARDGAVSAETVATYAAQSLQGAAATAVSAAAVAQTAATSAAASWDSLDNRYLGPKATAPTADNKGNPLQAGALYLNTGDGLLYIFSNGVWSKTTPNSAITVQKTTATEGQTVFTAPQFTAGSNTVSVFINGVRMSLTDDYTEAVNGQSITLTSAASAGDVVLVHVVQTLAFGSTAANLVTASDGASGSLFTTVAGFINRLMSSAGSALIGFLQSGTGAVVRSIFDKLSDSVSVVDFGADPTGVAVSKLAILRAHQTGKRVFYPSGTYNLGDLQQSGAVSEVAVDFTGLGSIHMDTGPSVVFKTNMTSAGITYAFKFDGNSNSTVGDCRFVGTGYNPLATWQGTTPFLLTADTGNWGDVNFGRIYCKDLVSAHTVSGGSNSVRIRGIKIAALFLDNTYYGYNGQNQGDAVEIGYIYHYQGYRALFVYGVTGVDAPNINIRNPRSTTGTVCIASYPGNPTKGVRAKVRSWDVAVTLNHILFANFGPDFASASITECDLDYDITDSNSANPLVKIVTYSASGGTEVTTATAAQFHDNRVNGVAVGDPGYVTCTAQYSSPQRNSAEGVTPERLDFSAFSNLQWCSRKTYTPAWTADGGTFPAIGNGSLSGEFFIENKRVHVNVALTIGSTTTLGSGAWYFGTPYGLSTKSQLNAAAGIGRILRSGVAFKVAAVSQGAGSNVVQLTAHDGASQIGPITPHAWVNGDVVLFSYSFPI